MTDGVKIEVFVARGQVERVTNAIVDAVHTDSPGDGIVAIFPVERVISARTRGDAMPNWIRKEG